jgi:hypothetical protein
MSSAVGALETAVVVDADAFERDLADGVGVYPGGSGIVLDPDLVVGGAVSRRTQSGVSVDAISIIWRWGVLV